MDYCLERTKKGYPLSAYTIKKEEQFVSFTFLATSSAKVVSDRLGCQILK